jgi:hypothetical protein
MAAGPWFTVRTNESGWQVMDHIWISNGSTDEKATVEYRSVLEEPAPTAPGVVEPGPIAMEVTP